MCAQTALHSACLPVGVPGPSASAFPCQSLCPSAFRLEAVALCALPCVLRLAPHRLLTAFEAYKSLSAFQLSFITSWCNRAAGPVLCHYQHSAINVANEVMTLGLKIQAMQLHLSA